MCQHKDLYRKVADKGNQVSFLWDLESETQGSRAVQNRKAETGVSAGQRGEGSQDPTGPREWWRDSGQEQGCGLRDTVLSLMILLFCPTSGILTYEKVTFPEYSYIMSVLL